jgi:hypothetical protein
MIALMIVRAMIVGVIVMRVIMVVMRMIVRMMIVVLMVMVMMPVTVMIMGVIMMMMVVMLAVMVIMIVSMIMRMAMRRAGIGAPFRIERPFDRDDLRAEAARHVLDHVIAPDPERAPRQLDRQMTIAEMPGDPRQRDRVLAADLGERLRRRHHFDEAAVVEREAVAGAEHHGLRQVEQKGEALDAGHRHAAAVAVVIIEHD